MNFSIPYGRKKLEFTISNSLNPELIKTDPIEGLENPKKAVKFSLYSREYGPSIEDFRGCKTAAIAVNDKTRPVPYNVILPPLIDALASISIAPENISLIAATGTHNPMNEVEIREILPENLPAGIRIFTHDCDDDENLIHLGSTSRNTPVFGNKKFLKADVRIVTGNIEPHHFAGFSGGVKSASIGLSGRKTINANHKLLQESNSRLGEYDENPLRQDIEEIGRLYKVNFALNVIMNDNREIVHILSGDPFRVMSKGVSLSRAICQTPVKKKFDVVIASAGGFPKDINLYQSQKALTNASLITRDGGSVILVAACEEGTGSQGYEDFMEGVKTWQEVYQKFEREEFRVGPHKAFQFARELSRIQVYLLSEIADERVSTLLLKPFHNLTGLIKDIQSDSPEPLSIAILPKATNTIPHFTGSM
ncbi:MAG: nickel-dependent lactate racemase [Anaerolineaceae bacterium]